MRFTKPVQGTVAARLRSLTIAALCLALAGCATTGGGGTATGRPTRPRSTTRSRCSVVRPAWPGRPLASPPRAAPRARVPALPQPPPRPASPPPTATASAARSRIAPSSISRPAGLTLRSSAPPASTTWPRRA